MANKPLLLSVCASPELKTLLDITAASQGLRLAKINKYLTQTSRFDLSQFPQNAPWVAFVDFTSDPEQGIKTAEVLSTFVSPRIWTVGVSSSADTDILMRAMSAGCCEFLHLPSTEFLIESALNKIVRRISLLETESKPTGRVAAFIGVRGGVGATTLAVHTAIEAANFAGPNKVLLVDLKRQLGHVAIYLNLPNPGHSFAHALANVDRLDADLLQSMLVRHSDSLSILASPDDCSALESSMSQQQYHPSKPTDEAVDNVLNHLRAANDLTIFDADPLLPETIAVARRADFVYIVASLDIGSIRDVARYMDTLGRDLDRQKLKVTHVEVGVMKPEMIGNPAGIPIIATFPNLSGPISSAINAGIPVPRQVRAFYAGLAPILAELGDDVKTVVPKKSFFARRAK